MGGLVQYHPAKLLRQNQRKRQTQCKRGGAPFPPGSDSFHVLPNLFLFLQLQNVIPRVNRYPDAFIVGVRVNLSPQLFHCLVSRVNERLPQLCLGFKEGVLEQSNALLCAVRFFHFSLQLLFFSLQLFQDFNFFPCLRCPVFKPFFLDSFFPQLSARFSNRLQGVDKLFFVKLQGPCLFQGLFKQGLFLPQLPSSHHELFQRPQFLQVPLQGLEVF